MFSTRRAAKRAKQTILQSLKVQRLSRDFFVKQQRCDVSGVNLYQSSKQLINLAVPCLGRNFFPSCPETCQWSKHDQPFISRRPF